jgi:DNA-binding GntR family transcriptional regulator
MEHSLLTIVPSPDQRLADAVAERLRAAIQSGHYPPGARLVERTLARQLSVSHIPIREALTRLEKEGIVVRHPRRGARVAELSPRLLDEISTVRAVLEGLVARRVQERWTPAVEQELRAVVREMGAAAEQRAPAAMVALDERFHLRLWELSDHDILLELAAQLRGRVSRFLSEATRLLDDDGLRMHARSHARLVDALASSDRAAAQRAMRSHVMTAARRIERAEGLVGAE